MNKEQILKKVIEKAVKNGWELGNEWPRFEVILAGVAFFNSNAKNYAHDPNSGNVYSIEEIIFDHSFAKAFWGSERVVLHKETTGETELLPLAWQHHLQQLAIAKDRLKYLEKFLKEDK